MTWNGKQIIGILSEHFRVLLTSFYENFSRWTKIDFKVLLFFLPLLLCYLISEENSPFFISWQAYICFYSKYMLCTCMQVCWKNEFENWFKEILNIQLVITYEIQFLHKKIKLYEYKCSTLMLTPWFLWNRMFLKSTGRILPPLLCLLSILLVDSVIREKTFLQQPSLYFPLMIMVSLTH